MRDLWRDLVFGWRTLSGSKVFTVVAIVTIALAIGPNTAIFSLFYATLLERLPYPHAERLVVVWGHTRGQRMLMPGDHYEAYAEQATSFEGLGANRQIRLNLAIDDDYEEVVASPMTPSLSATMEGWGIGMGREFVPADTKEGNHRVVTLNHQGWMERFQGDPNILGKQLNFDGESYTVVGVRAAGPLDRLPQFQVPMTPSLAAMGVVVFGRLKPGVTRERAAAELTAISRHVFEERRGRIPEGWTVSVEPLKADFISDTVRSNLWLMMGTVVLVLLIACANVANLLLARAVSRQREVAVRASLGASRNRLFRQFFVESLNLALMGGALGVFLGWAVLKAVLALRPPEFPVSAETNPRLSLAVLLFTLGATVFSGVLFGCVTAWRAARPDLGEVLKQGSRSVLAGGRGRLQRVLVAGEFALALTLLTAAGLAVHSVWNMTQVDLGVRTDRIFTTYLQVPRTRFTAQEQVAPFFRQILDRVGSTPGVATAALSLGLPLQGSARLPFDIAGRPTGNPAERPVAEVMIVSPEYFQALNVQVARGRAFTEADAANAEPVAIVSDDFAPRWLPDTDPLAAYLMVARLQITPPYLGEPVQRRIVGVFHRIRTAPLESVEDAPPQVLIPYWQNPWFNVALVVRTGGDPASMTKDISRAVHSVEPMARLSQPGALEDVVDSQIASPRFAAGIYASFAVLALILAAVGVYGVMAFSVTQRTHEIGLRIALGAPGSKVVRLILKDAVKLAGIGLVVGAGGAYAAHRVMRAAVFGIGRIDWAALVAVAAILVAAALVAAYVPARRATKVEPVAALREE